jgi:hypothetical protein
MLSYDFYACDEGRKTKNLEAGAGLQQRYEMEVWVANKSGEINI